MPGSDVDGRPDQGGVAHQLLDLAGAVGGQRGADVPAGPLEVVDEEVAPGQPGADLAHLEPVAVGACRLQRVVEDAAGLVDQARLEQHLGMVEASPVAADRGIHPVGGPHQHQGPREVSVDEGQAGQVVPGLELLVREPVGARRSRPLG